MKLDYDHTLNLLTNGAFHAHADSRDDLAVAAVPDRLRGQREDLGGAVVRARSARVLVNILYYEHTSIGREAARASSQGEARHDESEPFHLELTTRGAGRYG